MAKCNSEEQHEIREYVNDKLYELARDFCVPTGTIVTALENVQDDAALAVRLLENHPDESRGLCNVINGRPIAPRYRLQGKCRRTCEHGPESGDVGRRSVVHVDMISSSASALNQE